ncbi:MAG: ATP-grasp domain-containing protein [Candidatus Pacebacteria bacterium]|nr:ATP-grasp domain-containing protein [Candidatus Paceibacterota bacterium]
MKRKYNILLTASGLSPVGINTALSLREITHKLIGVDVTNDNTASYFVDSFYKVPLASQKKDFLRTLLKISKREKIDCIFPLTLEESLVLTKNSKIFEKNKIKIANLNNQNILKICNDKWLTNRYLLKKGIPVPKAFSPKNIAELKKMVKLLGYSQNKVVFKPRVTHGSRGFRILASQYDRYSLLMDQKPTDNIYLSLDQIIFDLKTKKSFPKIIIMDFLEGEDYSVYCFCDKGEALVILPMKRSGLLPGMSLGGKIIFNNDIIEYVRRIIKSFNFSGPINIQLKNTEFGPFIYEINTRVSATTIAARGVGLNFPLLMVLFCMGREKEVIKIISKIKIKWGTEIYRVQREIFKYNNQYFEI